MALKKFRQNVYCNPYILQIINIEYSLQFLKFKDKINFDPKLYFFYFSGSNSRER